MQFASIYPGESSVTAYFVSVFFSLLKLRMFLRGAFFVVVVTLKVGLGLMLGIKLSRTGSPLGVMQ